MSDDPVWQSDEWKEARSRLLEEECQQCQSTDKLSLVHLWKPPRYRSIKFKVEEEIIRKLIDENNLKPFDTSDLASDQLRNACPSCNSINIRERKTKRPRYKCGRCSHEYDKINQIIVRDEFQFNKLYNSWKQQVLRNYQDKIEATIIQKQEEYDQKYRSGEGTTTMCGKCAFLWTQKQMKLCLQCGENYHKKRYDSCYKCYQQDDMVLCEKCGKNKIKPQPGDLNICEDCYEKMWNELTE